MGCLLSISDKINFDNHSPFNVWFRWSDRQSTPISPRAVPELRGTLVKFQNKRKYQIAVVGLAFACFLSFVSAAYADKSFHTVQLPLVLTASGETAGFPQLVVGHVVDIHADGPTVYAIEQYMVNGAKPNTEYQVADVVWIGGCPSDPSTHPSVALPTVVLTTNANGFAQGNYKITPDTITSFGLHGATLGIVWTLTSDDVVAYSTLSCINVALD